MSRKPGSARLLVDVDVKKPRSSSEPIIHDITAEGRDPTLLQVNDVAECSKIITLFVSVGLVAMDT